VLQGRRQRLSSGCYLLDGLLGGGLPCSPIVTEIVGPPTACTIVDHSGHLMTTTVCSCPASALVCAAGNAGASKHPSFMTVFMHAGEAAVGKTTLCMQLMLMALLPASLGGLGGRAMFAPPSFSA
jgi:Rad51